MPEKYKRRQVTCTCRRFPVKEVTSSSPHRGDPSHLLFRGSIGLLDFFFSLSRFYVVCEVSLGQSYASVLLSESVEFCKDFSCMSFFLSLLVRFLFSKRSLFGIGESIVLSLSLCFLSFLLFFSCSLLSLSLSVLLGKRCLVLS